MAVPSKKREVHKKCFSRKRGSSTVWNYAKGTLLSLQERATVMKRL
jgi:hypothetical protein